MPKVNPAPKKRGPTKRPRTKKRVRVTGTPSMETISDTLEILRNVGSELDELENDTRDLATMYKSLLREQHFESGHRVLDTLDILFEKLEVLGSFLTEEYPSYANLADLVERSYGAES